MGKEEKWEKRDNLEAFKMGKKERRKMKEKKKMKGKRKIYSSWGFWGFLKTAK